MGVKYLAKRLRDSSKTPDEFAKDVRLKGKRIGIDASVILHKALGTNDGASYFHATPENPNGEVVEKCSRLCGWAKTNEITLVVSIDGQYHPMKGAVNEERADERDSSLAKFNAMLREEKGGYDKKKTKKAFKLMKAAACVSETVISTAIEVFRSYDNEVYGAPYESDFQLVHWELSGFTDGTYTIDSDIFAMGSKMVIDLVNFNSANGKCVVLLRQEVQRRVMEGSEKWSDEDMILFSALSGCDFVQRLYRVKTKEIESLMKKWKDPNNNEPL